MPTWDVDFDRGIGTRLYVRLQRQRNERWQVFTAQVTVKLYPFAHQIGVDAVAQRNTGDGGTGLQTFLADLGFERLGKSVVVAWRSAYGLKMVST
jgi:hypothetical protein